MTILKHHLTEQEDELLGNYLDNIQVDLVAASLPGMYEELTRILDKAAPEAPLFAATIGEILEAFRAYLKVVVDVANKDPKIHLERERIQRENAG